MRVCGVPNNWLPCQPRQKPVVEANLLILDFRLTMQLNKILTKEYKKVKFKKKRDTKVQKKRVKINDLQMGTMLLKMSGSNT